MVLRQTKFLLPRHPADRLARPRLVERLRDGLEHRLALLVAPPGYGKTTLMAQAAEALALPTAWVQLDDGDNDPVAFVATLAEALARALPEAGERARALLRDAGPQPAERALVLLTNELTEPGGAPWLLALDDLHLLRNPAVHALLAGLLEAPPPGLRVLLASRSVPPLPLHRLRARGRLLELGAEQLRFRPDEARRLLAAAAPGLDADVADLLVARTEGWGAGLRLAASLLADAAGPEGDDLAAGRRDAWVARLSGAHPYVAEYLLDEALERQPPERQRFLLDTAVLPQLDAELVGALLDDPAAGARLEELERAQAFVAPLDGERRWYRYHGLFREFLLGRLAATDPARLGRLRARAAGLLEARGEAEAALRAHLENGDAAGAAGLLERVGHERLEHGRVDGLAADLERLGPALDDRPELLLLHGRALRRLGRPADAAARLERARAAALARPDAALACAAATELAALARLQGDADRARRRAAEAVAAGPGLPPALRAEALMELAKNEGLLEGMDRGRALAEEAAAALGEAGAGVGPAGRARLLRSLGQICWWHGDVEAAVGAFRRALAGLPAAETPLAAELHLALAVPTLYRHETEAALAHAERALALCQRFELRERLPAAYAVLGNALTRQGRLERAEACLRRAVDLAADQGPASYDRALAAAYLAYCLQRQGRPDEAAQIAEAALWPHGGRPVVYEVYVCRSVLADCRLDAGRAPEAEAIFEELVTLGEARQYRVPLAMAHFGLAALRLGRGDRDGGLAAARRSLALLEPTRAWELYADQGERARRVCAALEADRPGNPFVARVLEALREPAPPRPAPLRDDRLRVVTLGGLEVLRGGAPVPARAWVSAKARELLALFVTLRHEEVPLARAMDALWPDEPERDKAAFHTALYRLRGALREDGEKTAFVVAANKAYHLDVSRFDLDVERFERRLEAARGAAGAAAEAAWREALELYRGDYLDGFEHPWLQPERQRLRAARLEALEALAGLLAERGEVAEALHWTRRQLAEEPLQERAHCAAMRLLHRLGDRGGVRRQYRELRDLLDTELRLEPLPETQRLYRELMGGPPA